MDLDHNKSWQHCSLHLGQSPTDQGHQISQLGKERKVPWSNPFCTNTMQSNSGHAKCQIIGCAQATSASSLVRSTNGCSESKSYSWLAQSWVLPTLLPCSGEKKEPPRSPELITLRYQVWSDAQNWCEGCSFCHCPSLQFFIFGFLGNPGEVIFHLVIVFRSWSYYQSCILFDVYYEQYPND